MGECYRFPMGKISVNEPAVAARPSREADRDNMARLCGILEIRDGEETLRRFLLVQFLTMYANEKFELRARGQETLVCLAPHTPMRQKQLNELVADSFYRDLFMSPCLSGWDRGEEKYHCRI